RIQPGEHSHDGPLGAAQVEVAPETHVPVLLGDRLGHRQLVQSRPILPAGDELDVGLRDEHSRGESREEGVGSLAILLDGIDAHYGRGHYPGLPIGPAHTRCVLDDSQILTLDHALQRVGGAATEYYSGAAAVCGVLAGEDLGTLADGQQ